MEINSEVAINLDKLNLTRQKFQNLSSKLEDKKLKEACNDFEAFFMQQFLDISLKNINIAGKETGSEIIKGMYAESLSKASSGSVGISDILYKFLSEHKKGSYG